MVDQWRGDCLGISGHPAVQTPYLDGLALEGVRFERAYSATPSCIAARAALFTGLAQRNHGRVGYRDGVEWNYPVTLAGEFTRQGYQTQAVGKMHVYPERSQLGFQNVILHDGFLHFARRGTNYDLIDDYLPWLRDQLGRHDADYFEHGLNCNSQVARPWDKPEHTHPTNWVTGQAIDFLRRRDPRKPFFLFVSYHRPHPPYDPPAWAFEQYLQRDLPPVPVGDWADLFEPYTQPRSPQLAAGRLDRHALHRARAGYYGHITHIDHQINRLLEMLHEYGLRDDTWVCFTSDHGELLGDHDLFRKSLPYEGSARVPLILTGPREGGLRRGASSDAVVELRDVMPTLLDAAGLEVPAGLDGHSLLPIARGQAVRAHPHIHGEHPFMDQSVHYVTDGHEKFLWFSGTGREQLFDLDEDPQELHDLAGLHEATASQTKWRGVLIDELTDRPEGFVDQGRLVPGRPVTAVLPM